MLIKGGPRWRQGGGLRVHASATHNRTAGPSCLQRRFPGEQRRTEDDSQFRTITCGHPDPLRHSGPRGTQPAQCSRFSHSPCITSSRRHMRVTSSRVQMSGALGGQRLLDNTLEPWTVPERVCSPCGRRSRSWVTPERGAMPSDGRRAGHLLWWRICLSRRGALRSQCLSSTTYFNAAGRCASETNATLVPPAPVRKPPQSADDQCTSRQRLQRHQVPRPAVHPDRGDHRHHRDCHRPSVAGATRQGKRTTTSVQCGTCVTAQPANKRRRHRRSDRIRRRAGSATGEPLYRRRQDHQRFSPGSGTAPPEILPTGPSGGARHGLTVTVTAGRWW